MSTVATDEGQIRQLLADYEAALNLGDASAAVGQYAADGQFLPQGMPTMSGEELSAFYERIFSSGPVNIVFQIDEVRVSGDLAFATTSTRDRATESGAPQTRELFVFVRRGGQWKILRYMFNSPPAGA